MPSPTFILSGVSESVPVYTVPRDGRVREREQATQPLKVASPMFRCGNMPPSRSRACLVWWSLFDGWPQVPDAVVDYYGERKLAYSYIQRS